VYVRDELGVDMAPDAISDRVVRTLHGLFAGTDSALPMTKFLYAGTFLVVIFFTAYWLVMRLLGKDPKPAETATTRVNVQRTYK